MTMSIAVDVTTIPRIKHAEAMQITAVENRKVAAALGNLQPGDWAKPTDCTRWDVRALAAHMVGSPPARRPSPPPTALRPTTLPDLRSDETNVVLVRSGADSVREE
ncbi:MAG: hypothetical protein DLM61_08125 [Pseudonocardiales bacterium]|nr:maleylpyruvate isomerase N-terminal domain-containing protein [Pseudonocardiales bacterium]PZS31681.1 MAG: hypothetical protein DLM61_08125 [Pseudonocardiales bacterium]